MNVAVLVAATCVLAQQPNLGYVYPPIVPIGVATDVSLGGYDFTPDVEFFALDPQIKLEVLGQPGEFITQPPPYWIGPKGRTGASLIPREVPARIEIPKDFRSRRVRIQVANANGSSPTALCLTSALPVVLEARHRDSEQDVEALPVIVTGRLAVHGEIDQYRFKATATGPITLDLIARRLGAGFNGTLEVHDDTGRRIADAADTIGIDVALTFAAEAGRRYTVRVFDVDYRGHRSHVYGLKIIAGPRVVAAIPAAGRRGESRQVTFVGYGLKSDATKLETVTRTVTFPRARHQRSFVHHFEAPTGPTAAELSLSDHTETFRPAEIRVDPGTHIDRTALENPVGVTATLVAMEDRYTLKTEKGQTWSISLQARAIGSTLDPVLRVVGPDGKDAAQNDDANGTVDCSTDFTAPEAGVYTLIVADRSGQERTAASIYRLALDRVEEDFILTVPQHFNVPVGGKTDLAVTAKRRGGFVEEIVLAISGLPDGVTVPAVVKIPGDKNDVKIPVTATKDCATLTAYLRVVGAARIGDRDVARVATATARGSLCRSVPSGGQVSKILLATTMQSPVSIDVIGKNKQRAVHRGTTYPAPISIQRSAGYDGEIAVLMRAKQSRRRQGIWGPILPVPSGADTVLYPCFVPEWLSTSRTTRMEVFAMAKVIDPKGVERYLLSGAKSRVTMIFEGALLKVTHDGSAIEARPGEAFGVSVFVRRAAKLPEPATLEVVFPEDIRELVKCAPVVVPVGETSATIRVQPTTDASLLGEHNVIVRATALQDGKWSVVSQTTVAVVFVP